MEKDGKRFANAETTIDYKRKEISFKYPNKRKGKKEEALAFFCNAYYQGLSILLWVATIITFLTYIEVYTIEERHQLVEWSLVILVLTGYYIYTIIMGYLSIIVHKLSKTARRNFPKTNAIFDEMRKGKFKKIEIKRDKDIYFGGIKAGNKFYHTKYKITVFEYKYIGENKLMKVTTKSAERDDNEGEHFKFIAIFEFERKLEEGIILWR